MNVMKEEVFSEEVLSLEHRLAEAEQSGNPLALHRLVATDFAGINSHGRRVDRDEFIGEFTAADLLLESLQLDDLSVRAFDDIVVTTGRSRARGTLHGRVFQGRYWFTDVWARRPSRWELIAAHVSPAA